MKKFAYVDALRGVAILLVIFTHFGQWVPKDSLFFAVAPLGKYGVQLFFVMSAFTLCHSLNRMPKFDKYSYASFMARRWFRIAPMYYLAIPLYFIISVMFWNQTDPVGFTPIGDYTISHVLFHLFLVHGWVPSCFNYVVPGGWSIGCEFIFYSIFPFLFLWARRKATVLLYLCVVAFLVVAVMVFMRLHFGRIGAVGVSFYIYCSIFNQLPCFCMGILYFLYSQRFVFNRAFALVMIAGAMLLTYLDDTKLGMALTPGIAGVLSVGLALILEKQKIPSLLCKIGQYSFSMYIFHFAFVWIIGMVFRDRLPLYAQSSLTAIVGYGAVVACTYAISALSNRFIEEPFIALGGRVASAILALSGKHEQSGAAMKTARPVI